MRLKHVFTILVARIREITHPIIVSLCRGVDRMQPRHTYIGFFASGAECQRTNELGSAVCVFYALVNWFGVIRRFVACCTSVELRQRLCVAVKGCFCKLCIYIPDDEMKRIYFEDGFHCGRIMVLKIQNCVY